MSNVDIVEEKKTEEQATAPRAVFTLIREEDNILACALDPGQATFTLPGAFQKPGESEEDCQERGLLECAGAHTGERVKVYSGQNTSVYVANVDRTKAQRRGNLQCAWLSETDFLFRTHRPELFKKVLADVRTKAIAQSSVISKLRDGRILYAIQYEVFNGKEWLIEPETHFVHAMNAQDARTQFHQAYPSPRVKVIGVAPAIGFIERQEGILEGT